MDIKARKEELDRSLEATNTRTRALDEIAEEARTKLMDIVSEINRLEKAQELNTERLSAIGRDRERLTSEISELGSKLESEQQNAESLEEEGRRRRRKRGGRREGERERERERGREGGREGGREERERERERERES